MKAVIAIFMFFVLFAFNHALVIPQKQNADDVGQCPGGPSLPIQCDPARPWPTCPPQSYCYAVGGGISPPYYCCPVWSTLKKVKAT